MNKDVIFFDLDGTITDPKEGITKAVSHSLTAFGIEAGSLDELIGFIGPPLRESYRRFYGFGDDEIETAVEKYREYFSVKGIYENTLYEGMDTLLEKLKASGKTLALATTKPALYAAKILGHFAIDHCFAFVAGSEMDGRRSKKAELISHAISNLPPASPERMIMVGDRDLDIIGAKAAGIESIGVLFGYGTQSELEATGASYLANSVSELEKLLL